MSTIIYPAPIFGPVHSRRLGVSLGINLMPADGKVCTFDCVYCECGFNADFRPRQRRPTREEVREALEARLQDMQANGPAPDVLTFAGNGEPTAHPHFSEIIDDTLALRDRYFPKAKVSVLSNSTMLFRPEVVEALKRMGQLIIQTMFMKGTHDGLSVDNTTDRYVLPWLDAVRDIAPRQVMIYTIDRETPDRNLEKATPEELDRIAALVREAGMEVSVSY